MKINDGVERIVKERLSSEQIAIMQDVIDITPLNRENQVKILNVLLPPPNSKNIVSKFKPKKEPRDLAIALSRTESPKPRGIEHNV